MKHFTKILRVVGYLNPGEYTLTDANVAYAHDDSRPRNPIERYEANWNEHDEMEVLIRRDGITECKPIDSTDLHDLTHELQTRLENAGFERVGFASIAKRAGAEITEQGGIRFISR